MAMNPLTALLYPLYMATEVSKRHPLLTKMEPLLDGGLHNSQKHKELGKILREFTKEEVLKDLAENGMALKQLKHAEAILNNLWALLSLDWCDYYQAANEISRKLAQRFMKDAEADDDKMKQEVLKSMALMIIMEKERE